MNKKTIIGIIAVVLVVVASLVIKVVLDKDIEKEQNKLNETKDEFGVVAEETVANLVAKFNTQVVDNSKLNPASEDYLTYDDNTYWYGLEEDLYFAIEPVEYKDDKKKEISEFMLLFVRNSYKDEAKVLEYAKYLIKANNNELTDDEIKSLLDDAKELSTEGKVAKNGKGITVGCVYAEDHYEIQVARIYK